MLVHAVPRMSSGSVIPDAYYETTLWNRTRRTAVLGAADVHVRLDGCRQLLCANPGVGMESARSERGSAILADRHRCLGLLQVTLVDCAPASSGGCDHTLGSGGAPTPGMRGRTTRGERHMRER